jgi:hypothetical protein
MLAQFQTTQSKVNGVTIHLQPDGNMPPLLLHGVP